MEIKICKGSRACVVCEHAFAHEEELTSVARIEHQLLVREDYCKACWNPDRAAGAFSVWSPRFYDPKVAEQQPPEVFSPLRQLFYEAVESEDRGEIAVAYLAAHLLRRQRAFRLLKESDDGEKEVRVILFADRIGNRIIEVRDPNLTYAELESGRRTLLERLEALENPPVTEENQDDAHSQQE
jgi:hypothetical protein